MNSKFLLFVIASMVIVSYSVNDTFADSDEVTPSVSFDRTVYPVPFGGFDDFEDTASSHPDGRSLFPVHMTAIRGNSIDTSTTLDTGDLTIYIKINNTNFDISPQEVNEISQDMDDNIVGPLKISVLRDSQSMILAYAGGDTPNENGLIDVGDNNLKSVRELGSIYETAPDSGVFELDFVIRYTDGPSNSRCPTTVVFTSLNDDAISGSEESRFDLPSIEKENYCIMNGDVLTVEYTSLDASGNVNVVTDSATFELRNGILESDRPVYIIGSDMILSLIDLDLDLDSEVAETITLDLIEWDSDAATIAMGELGGELPAFDPEPFDFRETGDSTGVFQIVIEVPKSLGGDTLEGGEEIVLEYTDWGPSGADYVGNEDEDVNLTVYTLHFGATVDLDKKVYTWTDKVYITIVAPDHNFDSDSVDEIGNTDQYPVKVATRNFALDNYKLVETGYDTGIFTGEVTLTKSTNADSTPSGTGPTDGLLPASGDDGIIISFEFSEGETVVRSALVYSNKEQSPLKQQMEGVHPNDVVCNDGLSKVYKYDRSAICVKSTSVDKLVQQGFTLLR